MVEILKVLANDKRLKIIYALTLGDFCQLHVREITKIGQVDVSRNAAKLIELKVLDSYKHKNRIIYCLNDEFKCEYGYLLKQIIAEYSYLGKQIDQEDLKKRCREY